MSNVPATFKRLILGRPMSSGELEHTLLPKTIALPVFASDALSSMAYATQEVLLVLLLAGSAALSTVVPISFAVATLLAVVIISYRQIVRAYPRGGGAYAVAYENLGTYPGLVVGAALLIDYVLTVAVSITAGADAIVSAAPALLDQKIPLAIALVLFVTMINLRGAKESGKLFAVPTYGFVVSIYLLIATGVVKCLNGCPQAESAGLEVESVALLTPLLLLRAFSAGTTALTGVEAIAEGVPVFRYPQSRNAAATLGILGGLSISMFIGISWLADRTNVVFTEESARTLVAQIADAVFAGGPLFLLVQIMTAAILVLAANTAYTGFPVLASILARDRFMPRQFMSRGDRLVLSNGIVILAVSSSLLIYAFNANLTRLIQLYLVGVFLSFTLAQFGTVLRWRKTREPRWQRSAVINGIGAAVTGIVLIVVIITKFPEGAWIVIAGIPVIMFLMLSVHRHYQGLAEQLVMEERRPTDRRPGNQHIVIFVPYVHAAAARAVGYARSVRAAEVSAITFRDTNHAAWRRVAPDIPLTTLHGNGSRTARIRAFLREKRSDLGDDDFLTLAVPEVLEIKSILEILLRPRLHRLKAALLAEPGVQVLDVPIVKDQIRPEADEAQEPARNYVLVLVANVHNATLQAIEYAETLQASGVRAVSFGLDPEATEKLGNEWLDAQVPHPLEIEASPFRNIGITLGHYVRRFNADGVDRVVTVVIPEFVVSKKRHQLLHGQTALIVKRHLLFERGVVVASVPYHLED